MVISNGQQTENFFVWMIFYLLVNVKGVSTKRMVLSGQKREVKGMVVSG